MPHPGASDLSSSSAPFPTKKGDVHGGPLGRRREPRWDCYSGPTGIIGESARQRRRVTYVLLTLQQPAAGAFLQKTGVRKAQAFLQRDPRAPTEGVQLGGVQELLGCAIGLRAVVGDAGIAFDDALDDFGQLANGLVLAVADVEERGLLRVEGGGDLPLRQVHQEDAGVGRVVAVDELTTRLAGAPQHHGFLAAYLRLVEFADQRGQDVAGLEIVVVPGPVHVVRHGAEVARAVLAGVGAGTPAARELPPARRTGGWHAGGRSGACLPSRARARLPRGG